MAAQKGSESGSGWRGRGRVVIVIFPSFPSQDHGPAHVASAKQYPIAVRDREPRVGDLRGGLTAQLPHSLDEQEQAPHAWLVRREAAAVGVLSITGSGRGYRSLPRMCKHIIGSNYPNGNKKGLKPIPSLEESRDQIEEILTQKRIDQALDQWIKDTRNQVPTLTWTRR